MRFAQPSVVDDFLFRVRERGPKEIGLTVLVPTVAIVTGESALFFGHRWSALCVYSLLLLFCLLLPLQIRQVDLLSVFALVPLFRLLNLTIPAFVASVVYHHLLVFGLLLPPTYLVARSAKHIDVHPGLWMGCLFVIPGIALGAAIGYLNLLLFESGRGLPSSMDTSLLGITIAAVVLVAVIEELLFRGLLQRVLAAQIGPLAGIVLAAALYGMMYAPYGIPIQLLFGGVFGLLLGVIYERTNSLLLISIIHGMASVVLLNLVPLSDLLALIGQ